MKLVISQFNISREPIPAHVVDIIHEYHYKPLNRINECTSLNCYPSQNSCYRPYHWEVVRGRSGSSQHCFGERNDATFDKDNKGACDITCADFDQNKSILLDHLLSYTNYTRLAIYNTFIHADYKHTGEGVQIFESNSASKWKYIKTV